VVPYVVDFGAPELAPGGLERNLDDHVRAVVSALHRVRAIEGRDVHLLGYSQGGMFAYQAAAYVRSEGVASVVTFGSPVDLHKNLPAIRSDVAGALVRAVEPAISAVATRLESLPGKVTSTGFKLLSTRKELEQRIEFLRLLHDRRALERREARRRFLGGAGFVAWPGPAFRAFVDQFVVHNRMLTGGFVVDGRLVSLADIRCPVLAFVGSSDELARPATVHAIASAAPEADVSFVTVPAGHFGLVVGSRANQLTWPTVAEWLAHVDGLGPVPTVLRPRERAGDDLDPDDFELDVELLFGGAVQKARAAWERLGEVMASASDTADAVRWQEPRLRRLARIEPDTVLSPSLELARAAQRTPDATFFLWRGRAFSYADADRRTNAVVRGLFAAGVRPGEKVAVVMGSRPSFLSAVTALGRLGAIPVLAPPECAGSSALEDALARLDVRRIVTDAEREPAAGGARRDVLLLGAGPRRTGTGALDLERLDVETVVLPGSLQLDASHARDTAMILLRPRPDGLLRAAPVTNHRWALSAFGAAAVCTLKPGDTVYSAIPLHHPTGILVAVGAAIAGGARLALGEPPRSPAELDGRELLRDVRRSGANVLFYAGEMLRALLDVPPSRGDRTLPVRLFAGSGCRVDLAERVRERFGVSTTEFYAGTTHRAILAAPQGGAPGTLGRVLPGSAEVRVVAVDLPGGQPRRGEGGRLELAPAGEPGLLAVRLDGDDPVAPGDDTRVEANAFVDGDAWLLTSDVLVRDAEGGHTFVDALAGFVATRGGPVSTRAVEDALHDVPEVRQAAAWGEDGVLVAAVVTPGPLDAARLARALAKLPAHARPREVVRLAHIPLSEGFRVAKAGLPRAAAEAAERVTLDPAGPFGDALGTRKPGGHDLDGSSGSR
jgi:putative long chain acyl-CoA synthase